MELKQIKSNVSFFEKGKPEYPAKNLSEQLRVENQRTQDMTLHESKRLFLESPEISLARKSHCGTAILLFLKTGLLTRFQKNKSKMIGKFDALIKIQRKMWSPKIFGLLRSRLHADLQTGTLVEDECFPPFPNPTPP